MSLLTLSFIVKTKTRIKIQSGKSKLGLRKLHIDGNVKSSKINLSAKSTLDKKRSEEIIGFQGVMKIHAALTLMRIWRVNMKVEVKIMIIEIWTLIIQLRIKVEDLE